MPFPSLFCLLALPIKESSLTEGLLYPKNDSRTPFSPRPRFSFLLSACDSYVVALNWSRSLIFRIRRMAAVAPGLELRILMIFPRKSANFSSRITRHIGYFNRIYYTVIASSSHAQRLLYTPRTLLLIRSLRTRFSPYEVI
jgi:hypothetical protein